jgi:hypothetical protein
VTEIPLAPESGYAFEATWRSITAQGDAIVAVGGAPGGAHSNTRWTVWTGSATGLREIPQTFGTFGGVGAGDLIGPVATSAGVFIAGTWQGARTGLDAAVWLPEGDKWIRQPSAGTALESTPDLLVTPHAATGWGAGGVLAGSVVHLKTGDVREAAAVWRSQRRGGGWTRVDLPGAGRRSEALSVGCTPTTCVFAGYADGALALWTMTSTQTRRLPGLPDVPADTGVKLPAPLASGDAVVQVASDAGAVVVLTSSGDRWTRAAGPAGVATGSGLAGGWLYVSVEQPDGSAALWRCPIGAVTG